MTNKHKLITFWILLVAVLLTAATALAWFSLSSRQALTEPAALDMPPTINVLNNETTHLDILNLDGLRRGETYQIVFCVTPSSPGIVKLFDLELAYTTNLKEQIDLYTATYVGTTDPGGDGIVSKQSRTDPEVFNYYRKGVAPTLRVTGTGNGYTAAETAAVQPDNLTVYKTYSDAVNLRFADPQGAWTADWADNPSRYLFYILEITWPEDTANVDSKETDIVYITARGRAATAE